MPTYDYRCSTCGTDFEVFQTFSQDALKKCPLKRSGDSPETCTSPGRGKVEKVFSAPGITFKGSGFYKNDSRSGSKKSSSSSSKSKKSEKTSDSGSSSGSDSKDKPKQKSSAAPKKS